MKSLVSFIKEKYLTEGCDEENSKEFTFNFSGLNDVKDAVKSLKTTADGAGLKATLEEDTFTLCICPECIDKATSVIDAINGIITAQNKKPERINNNEYGTKVTKLEKSLAAVKAYVDKEKEAAAAEQKPENNENGDAEGKKNDSKSKKDDEQE